MKMQLKIIATLLAVGAASSTSMAATVFTTEHIDLALRRASPPLPGHPSGWELYIRDKDNEFDSPLATSMVNVESSALRTRPSGSQWDFLGVSAGASVFILPQSQDGALVYMGIGAEDASVLSTVSGDMTLTLQSVGGPGQFSLYRLAGGSPVPVMTSSNGITSADSVAVPINSHIHYNWAFTAAGSYSLGFTITGTPIGAPAPVTSEPFLVSFSVIPEPAHLLLGGLMSSCLLKRSARPARLRPR
jgi:surface-anchored protein